MRNPLQNLEYEESCHQLFEHPVACDHIVCKESTQPDQPGKIYRPAVMPFLQSFGFPFPYAECSKRDKIIQLVQKQGTVECS